MLTDISKKRNHIKFNPICIVNDQGRQLSTIKVEKSTSPGHESSLRTASPPHEALAHARTILPGSPIMPVAPPTNKIGRCPSQLESAQREQRHQVTHMQTVSRRIKPTINAVMRFLGAL